VSLAALRNFADRMERSYLLRDLNHIRTLSKLP